MTESHKSEIGQKRICQITWGAGLKLYDWNLAAKIAVGLLWLVAAMSANAEIFPPEDVTPPSCDGNNIDALIEAIPPSSTSSEMLQRLRAIHNNFLLLSPRFILDSNIKRIFGAPPNKEKWWPSPWMLAKEIDGKDTSIFQSRFVFIFSVTSDHGTTKKSGHIIVQPQTAAYSVDMVEQSLTKEIMGRDDQKEAVMNGNISPHARYSYAGRAMPTNPKGYFEYHAKITRGLCSSQLDVRLQGDGRLWDVSIKQEQVEKFLSNKGD